MSNERISKKRVLILVLIVVALLVFATIWSETHKKEPEQVTLTTEQTQQETSNGESTPAEETQTNDANASKVSEQPDNINEMQSQIDNLNQQIAEKDATITDLQQQISELQNGQERNGGVTFQEFLKLYFWPDGYTYKMGGGQKLYSHYACTDEYSVDVNAYTFPCNRSLPLTRDNGLTIHMLMTTDGQILWTPNPWLEQVQ